jgi:hypothetical protein
MSISESPLGMMVFSWHSYVQRHGGRPSPRMTEQVYINPANSATRWRPKIGIDCVHILEFEGDECCPAVASGVEAQKLIAEGFEYVCSHNGYMLFRRRKQMRATFLPMSSGCMTRFIF